MKAIVIRSAGAPESLQLVNRPVPVPKPGEVLIRVYAAGINRPDIFQRQGRYPAPPGVVADIPGLEVSGVIEACGTAVTQWQPGDRVCALLPGGGYAEYATANALHCLPVPSGLSFAEAACVPETVFTVWHNVFQRGRLSSGDTFLVHGGSGGIGTTAIQLARLAGATVYATAGTDEKCDFCKNLGAASCVNYNSCDFATQFEPGTIDVLLDSVGAPYFDRNISLMADEGRLIFINAVGGAKASFNIGLLMQRRLTMTGSTLRGRDAAFKASLCRAVGEGVWPWLESGAFRPVIDRSFPLTDAAGAHAFMESGNVMGKLVLAVHH